MNDEFLVPMVYEFFIFGLTLIIVLMIAKRYRERKNIVIRYMFLFSVMMSLSILIAAFSRVLRYTDLWSLESGEKIELLAVTTALIGFGNVFMLGFCLEVFFKGTSTPRGRIIMVIYSILMVGFAIFAVWTGIFVRDLTEMIWGVLIVLSLLVYGTTMYSALKLTFRLEPGADKKGVQFIALSPLSIIMVFVLFFMDRIAGGDFTVYYYLAWFFVVISTITMYIGVIRPKWAINQPEMEE